MTQRPEISVVVALSRRDNDLPRLFQAYEKQTAQRDRFEVIVVNGGARSDVSRALEEHRRAFPATRVRAIDVDTRGAATAKNAGVRDAQSERLLFVSGDFIPSRTLVRAHLDFHRNLTEVPAVGIGPAFFSDELRRDPFRRWLEDSGNLFSVQFRFAEPIWTREYFYVSNTSLARALFQRLGGFDEGRAYEVGDDFEFGLRLRAAGVRSHFLAKAVAWHVRPVTLYERIEALRRNGEAARRPRIRRALGVHWQSVIDRSLPDLTALARRAGEREDAASNPDTRAARYQAELDLAFAEGYHGVCSAQEEPQAPGPGAPAHS